MVRVGSQCKLFLGCLLFAGLAVFAYAQNTDSDPLDRAGQVTLNGRAASYIVHHLPVNAFPQLPASVQSQLLRRGCLIPQSYEAHQPENVVHASLERPGSSDWAVLCSAGGNVSLLVFFADRPDPFGVATAPETSRLQAHGGTDILGFNWAIDPASPQNVHDAQIGMSYPSPRLDHDALADSVIDRKTIYRFCAGGIWKVVATED